MTFSNDPRSADDPYDLTRFVRAQENVYAQVLAEIRSGKFGDDHKNIKKSYPSLTGNGACDGP
jgi:uncharacterized protein (DUF1810 family)